MKAVRDSQFGGPEVLEIVELPDPHAGPGVIRVLYVTAWIAPIALPLPAPRFRVKRTAVRLAHTHYRGWSAVTCQPGRETRCSPWSRIAGSTTLSAARAW
jgi:hypothetical protein